MSLAIFLPLAILLIVFALGVVLNRHPVRSAMCLVAALFVLAMLFALLDAHLVAALQIVVYAGAVMVLFLFVIMLLNLQAEVMRSGLWLQRAVAVAGSGGLALLIIMSALRYQPAAPGTLPENFGTTVAVSEVLFTRFLLPFELTSLLLLVAIVGAVVMAKRKID